MMREIFRIVDEAGHYIKAGTLVERWRGGYRPLYCRPVVWRDAWVKEAHGPDSCGHHTQGIPARQLEPFCLIDFTLARIEQFLSEPSATLNP